jgi:hypothetical protein
MSNVLYQISATRQAGRGRPAQVWRPALRGAAVSVRRDENPRGAGMEKREII